MRFCWCAESAMHLARMWLNTLLCRVDNGLSLSDTLQRHDAWLREHGVCPGGRSVLPVTWTEWDLKVLQLELKSAC